MVEQCCDRSKQCRNNVATLCCAKNCRCNPFERVDCNCLEQFSQLSRVPLTSIVHVRNHLISNTRLRKNIFLKSTKELLTDSGALIKTLVLPICHWSGSILTACNRCSTPLLTSPAHRGHVSFVRMAYLQRDVTIYCQDLFHYSYDDNISTQDFMHDSCTCWKSMLAWIECLMAHISDFAPLQRSALFASRFVSLFHPVFTLGTRVFFSSCVAGCFGVGRRPMSLSGEVVTKTANCAGSSKQIEIFRKITIFFIYTCFDVAQVSHILQTCLTRKNFS